VGGAVGCADFCLLNNLFNNPFINLLDKLFNRLIEVDVGKRDHRQKMSL
jgi:hypothetical protein